MLFSPRFILNLIKDIWNYDAIVPDIQCDLKFILQLNAYKRWFNSVSFYLGKTYTDNIYPCNTPTLIRVLGLQWIFNSFSNQVTSIDLKNDFLRSQDWSFDHTIWRWHIISYIVCTMNFLHIIFLHSDSTIGYITSAAIVNYLFLSI